MLRNARVYISDVIDEVVIEATLWEHDGIKSAPPESITYKAQMSGAGEEVPHEWLKEALICLIETL